MEVKKYGLSRFQVPLEGECVKMGIAGGMPKARLHIKEPAQMKEW